MIVVMLGTQNNSFNRLLKKIEEMQEKNIIDKTEKIVIQKGYSDYFFKNKENIEEFKFVSKDKLEEYLKEAKYIITHAGVGSIISALKLNKKVIAVARRHEYKEHVNNHQIEITEIFNQKKYLIGISDVDDLEESIKKLEVFIPEKYILDNSRMLNIIEEYIDKI